MEAKRTTVKVVIDGQLGEDEWRDAAIAKDFTEFRPVIGGKETEGNHTITYLMYDNNGIYFGGYCYEKDLNHISKELVGRDGFGANDYIGIAFDTYNDKINGFEYIKMFIIRNQITSICRNGKIRKFIIGWVFCNKIIAKKKVL